MAKEPKTSLEGIFISFDGTTEGRADIWPRINREGKIDLADGINIDIEDIGYLISAFRIRLKRNNKGKLGGILMEMYKIKQEINAGRKVATFMEMENAVVKKNCDSDHPDIWIEDHDKKFASEVTYLEDEERLRLSHACGNWLKGKDVAPVVARIEEELKRIGARCHCHCWPPCTKKQFAEFLKEILNLLLTPFPVAALLDEERRKNNSPINRCDGPTDTIPWHDFPSLHCRANIFQEAGPPRLSILVLSANPNDFLNRLLRGGGLCMESIRGKEKHKENDRWLILVGTPH